jgi:hypothetical protein
MLMPDRHTVTKVSCHDRDTPRVSQKRDLRDTRVYVHVLRERSIRTEDFKRLLTKDEVAVPVARS